LLGEVVPILLQEAQVADVRRVTDAHFLGELPLEIGALPLELLGLLNHGRPFTVSLLRELIGLVEFTLKRPALLRQLLRIHGVALVLLRARCLRHLARLVRIGHRAPLATLAPQRGLLLGDELLLKLVERDAILM